MHRASASAPAILSALLVAAGCGGNGAGATASTASGSSTASGGGGASTSSGGGAPSASAGTGATGTTGAGGSGGAGTTGVGGSGGGTVASKWPDTTATIGVLVDQLPDGMTAGQQSFVAKHFVGSQKLTLALSAPLRALNPQFLVLHYHLAIWQSAPTTPFILDGMTWGNDYPTVNMNESWFWHNTAGQRIASTVDQKILMNLADPGFAAYWQSSLEAQVAAGQYDAIFFDSASPALLQGEVGGQDARLAGTGAKSTPIAEWGGKTYIQQWEAWIKPLNDALLAKGIPLIPNTSAFTTTWDDTDYSLTAGIFAEGYAGTSFVLADWQASTNTLLSLAAKGKIIILQNYLGAASDTATRLYYLGNYLLVKGNRTYLDYFDGGGPLEWFPEWGIDLGAPTTTGATVSDLLQGAVYRRDFAKGSVLVNPSSAPVTVALASSMKLVAPQSGGAVDAAGDTPGSITTMPVTSVVVPPTGAAILLQ